MTTPLFKYTKIRGPQVEFSKEFLISQDKYNNRETGSQLENLHVMGLSKNIKVPLKNKLT